jgi:hypothetical protein
VKPAVLAGNANSQSVVASAQNSKQTNNQTTKQTKKQRKQQTNKKQTNYELPLCSTRDLSSYFKVCEHKAVIFTNQSTNQPTNNKN